MKGENEIDLAYYGISVWTKVDPRIGLPALLRPLADKTVVRGGFRVTYDRFDDNVFDNTRKNPTYVANYEICCGTQLTGCGTPFVNG